jgi:hypothetical protein
LPGGLAKCICNFNGVRRIHPELVLRGMQQECPHNPYEISAFDAELVLRDVPWKSTQGGRQTQRFRRLEQRPACLHAPSNEVIPVVATPSSLRLGAALRLALRYAASSLPSSDSRIGAEPPPADAARSFPRVRHSDLSSPRPNQRKFKLNYRLRGSLLESRAWQILASAEAAQEERHLIEVRAVLLRTLEVIIQHMVVAIDLTAFRVETAP